MSSRYMLTLHADSARQLCMLILYVESACFVSDTVAPHKETVLSFASVTRVVLLTCWHVQIQFVCLNTQEACKAFSILPPDMSHSSTCMMSCCTL